MKKFSLALLICFICGLNSNVQAHHGCYSHAYLVHKDFYQTELTFPQCNKHSLLKETTTYYYSNGARRSYTYSTILNSDGSVLESGCFNVKHMVYNNQHYFYFYKNKKYTIIDDKGNILTTKKYKEMNEILPNRLLVKYDKKYGIIDLRENIIVPIKYKKFKQVDKNLFITNLNGYFGIIDSSNKILVRNEYDKISNLYETYLLKKEGKFGLADKKGNIILPADCEKIVKLGEFILVKKDNKYGVFDEYGKPLSEINYKKIRLERNNLEVKTKNGWKILTNTDNLL